MQDSLGALAIVAVVTLLTSAGAVFLHYKILIRLGVGLIKKRREGDDDDVGQRVFLRVFAVLFGVHVMQIVLFGVSMWGVLRFLPAAGIEGGEDTALAEAIYLSAITYTTVGFGDVSPTGAIRLLAAVESLVGFMLITWSASFAFINMERHWRAQVSEEASEDDGKNPGNAREDTHGDGGPRGTRTTTRDCPPDEE